MTTNVHNRDGKESRSHTRIITREEEAKTVTILRDTEHSKRKGYYSDVADLIEVLEDTGMRILETLELRYKDVSFKSNLIIVHCTIQVTERYAHLDPKKLVHTVERVGRLTLRFYASKDAWLNKQKGSTERSANKR